MAAEVAVWAETRAGLTAQLVEGEARGVEAREAVGVAMRTCEETRGHSLINSIHSLTAPARRRGAIAGRMACAERVRNVRQQGFIKEREREKGEDPNA
jgi:hypothetical protein